MYDPLSAENQLALQQAWRQLQEVARQELQLDSLEGQKQAPALDIQQAFASDGKRQQRFSREAAGLYVDYSRHAITPALWTGLVTLAKTAGVEAAAQKMFTGEAINHTWWC